MTTKVLVFVPGTLGSELWDADNKIWPGTAWEAVRGFSPERFAQLRKPGLQAKDIVRSAAGGIIGVYRSWIKAFEAISLGGGKSLFREEAAGGLPKTLYVFPYDWRVDLRETTKKLADFLESLVTNVPDANVSLVCHSMGGVVARYYLESGLYNQRRAFSKLSLLATFGTPHNGAPVAYAGAIGLHKTSFLSQAQTQLLANDPRYPSLYQLFPIPTQSFIWASDPRDAFKSFVADDATLVKDFQLNEESLQAWRELRKGMTGNRPAHVRYFYIVGSRQPTLVRLRWNSESKLLTKEELEDSGDGTVPLLASIDASIQSQFVGNSHVSLIDTWPARTTLAALFGATTLFEEETITSLSVRDTVVSTSDPVHLLIEFTPSIRQLAGEIIFQKATELPEGDGSREPKFVDFQAVPSLPIELAGASFTHVNLIAPPIDLRGIYRPVLKISGVAVPISGPAFAVQLAIATA